MRDDTPEIEYPSCFSGGITSPGAALCAAHPNSIRDLRQRQCGDGNCAATEARTRCAHTDAAQADSHNPGRKKRGASHGTVALIGKCAVTVYLRYNSYRKIIITRTGFPPDPNIPKYPPFSPDVPGYPLLYSIDGLFVEYGRLVIGGLINDLAGGGI